MSEKVTKLREQSTRGAQARKILEDSLFVEATKRVRDDIFAELEMTRWNDREEREWLDKELRAMKRVVAYLKQVMLTGDAASKELRQPNRIVRGLKRG